MPLTTSRVAARSTADVMHRSMMSTRAVRAALALCVVLLTGCASNSIQSALNVHGPESGRIASLWWVFLGVLCIVYVIVMALVFAALFRARRKHQGIGPFMHDMPIPHIENKELDHTNRSMKKTVVFGIGLTALIISILSVASYVTGSAVSEMPKRNPLIVEVIGRQWWWQFRYVDTVAEKRITVSNELHIPVGRPVILHLASRDVIHSFWVPNLNGKRDLIPGQKTSLCIQADTPGIYRGQCAEFCGHQHARMAFLVIADKPDDFSKWFYHTKEEAKPPMDSLAAIGRDVFVKGPCAMCHTIQGTPANGQTAPDLTHVASNLTIGAGSLPNKRGHLAGWILDAQSIKPGTKMPQNMLTAQELRALLHYLETLK